MIDASTGEELVHEDDNTFVAIAPHAGAIEPGTGDQAFTLADELDTCSAWSFEGSLANRSSFDAFHVPSSRIEPDNYRLLPAIADYDFETAVSFHGYTNNEIDIYLGGRLSTDRREAIAKQITDDTGLTTAVARPRDGLYNNYGGMLPSNIVNRLSRNGGLQLEQSKRVREEYVDGVCTSLANELR